MQLNKYLTINILNSICILKILSNFAARNKICGEICLLATTLKNAKISSMFCVFVTAPHFLWGLFYTYYYNGNIKTLTI